MAQRVGVQPSASHRAGFLAFGDLTPHVGKRAGVELACDLIERKHLLLAQLVEAMAPLQPPAAITLLKAAP